MRRTGLGSLGDPGDDAVTACAAVLRRELGWSDARTREEIASLRQLYPDPVPALHAGRRSAVP
jgi:hypothetical protein